MPSSFMQTYQAHVAERATLGIPPLPLSAKQTGDLIEQLSGFGAGNRAALFSTVGYSGQIRRFDFGRRIDTRWHAVGNQIDQGFFFTSLGGFELLDQITRLLR